MLKRQINILLNLRNSFIQKKTYHMSLFLNQDKSKAIKQYLVISLIKNLEYFE